MSTADETSLAAVARAAWAAAAALLCSRQPGTGLGGEPGLPQGLLCLELPDLGLNTGEHALALHELIGDRLLLACSLGHYPGLRGSSALELGPPQRHFLAERLDISEHLRILVTDALHHVEAAEEIVEVLRAERISTAPPPSPLM